MVAVIFEHLRHYVPALAGALASWGVLWAGRRVLISRLGALAERTENQVDDLLVELLRKTRAFTLIAIALFLGSRLLPDHPWIVQAASRGIVLVLLLQGALWASAAAGFLFGKARERATEEAPARQTSMRALAFASRVLIWSMFLLLCLDNLGVNITGLVAGLGVGGIAVALAVQNVLGDLFASLSIVLDKPFEAGDFIIVEDYIGTVEHVGLKTTRIRSISGEQIVISNGDLLKSRIRNFKRMEERRVVFNVGVTYQTPAAKLERISGMIREIIEAREGTRFDRAHFKSFGDSALIYEVVYFLTDPDYMVYMDTQQAINLGIFRAFEHEGIEFAYPTQTLFLARSPATGRAGALPE